jgi:hypothetical protein
MSAKREATWVETVGVLVLVAPVSVFVLAVRAAVLLALVGWFVAPLFPTMQVPPVMTVAGLLITVAALKTGTRRKEAEDARGPFEALLGDALQSLLTSLWLWGFGALVHWLGRLP